MKRILIGLLSLGSISSFAAPCTILIKNLNSDEQLKLKTSFSESQISGAEKNNNDFGILASERLVETDQVNPFGKKILKNERKYFLYEKGKILVETEYSSSINEIEGIITKLKSLKCK